MTEVITPKVEMYLTEGGPGWVDVSEDVISDLVFDFGIHGDSPKDRVANPGALSFDLDNNSTNSDGTRGYYTAGHTDVRAGFKVGVPVRVSLTHTTYGTKVKWEGTVQSARPVPGVRNPRTKVRAVDWMEEAQNSKLSLLPVQVDTQSDELFETVVDAMETAPPNGTSVSAGSDEYPFALDNAQDESTTVIQELHKIAMSEYGIIHVEAGVLTFEGRRVRGGAGNIRFALDELNVVRLDVDHERDDIRNRLQVKIHPRRVDAAATTVLFNLGSSQRIERNTDLTLNCPYRDPNQEAQRVGGSEMVTPVAVTDYGFNSDEDGGGTDLTSQLTVSYVGTPGGNTAKVLIENAGPQDGYLVKLQLRGKGVYDFEPVIFDVLDQDSVDEFGENAYTYDMPHQSSPSNGSDTAQFILALNKDESTRVRSVSFVANWSLENVEQAFNLRVSSRVSLTIDELDFAARPFFVNGFRYRIKPSGLTVVTLDLAPVDTTQFWLLEVDGRTELDETTILGYGLFVAGWVLDTSQLGSETFLN